MKYSFLLLFFISCQGNEASFIVSDKVNSNLERSIQKTVVEDSLDLDELDMFYILDIEQDEEHIYVEEGDTKEIIKIRKNDFQQYSFIKFEQGKGPGEILAINDYDVNDSYLVISDHGQQKILFFDKDGNFINEFVSDVVVDQIKILADNNLLIYTMSTSENLFHILDLNGEIKDSFQRLEPELHFLMYTGDLYADDKFVYFAGYSEPILKRYSLNNQKQEYSVNVIDAYESSANYLQSELGGYKMAGYTPGALYSSLGLAIGDGKIYTTTHHNGDPNYNFIDIYNAEDGRYLNSIQAKHYAKLRGLEVDGKYIFSIESRSNNNWLLKYRIQ